MPAVLLAIAGCFHWYEQPLPVPLSEQPKPVPSGRLRAGFGRADITPPPGVGLSGYGPEGKRAAGYRLRLYARALVLEDRAWEKVAILVADLGHVSPNLHRLTAERIRESTGIGADRLIISATHTHAGPGHHYAEREYNQGNSQVSGYDPAMVDFLVSRFARALLDEGVYVKGFFFPVVPRGQSRIRVQLSAAHSASHIERAVAAFTRVGQQLGVLAS